jgi:uncharacterized protein YraI
MKKLAIVSLAASAALFASVAAAAAAVATTDLNVREGPGTEYPVIGVLQAGEEVDIAGCQYGWCGLAGGGYASQGYLAFDEAAMPLAEEFPLAEEEVFIEEPGYPYD